MPRPSKPEAEKKQKPTPRRAKAAKERAVEELEKESREASENGRKAPQKVL